MRLRRTKDKKRGAAAVEFAFVAPVLFAMLIGMLEFGRVMMAQHVITMAAREGARESILLGSTQSTVETVVNSYASNSPGSESISIALSQNPSTATAGDMLTTTVTLPLSAVSLFGNSWFNEGAVITGTATMRKEGLD